MLVKVHQGWGRVWLVTMVMGMMLAGSNPARSQPPPPPPVKIELDSRPLAAPASDLVGVAGTSTDIWYQIWGRFPLAGAEVFETTDGNPVRIRPLVTNYGSTAFDISIQLTLVDTGQVLWQTTRTVPPGETLLQEYAWDTTGYAWQSGGAPRTAPYTLQGTCSIPGISCPGFSIQPIRVNPKPVVMIHGLGVQSRTAWDEMKGWMQAINAKWRGYAVSDGQFGVAPLDMGLFTTSVSATTPTKTLDQNAELLRQYIDKVRQAEGSWGVDLVTHGMGSQVARRYISRLMPNNSVQGKRAVNQLILLGATDLGSPCAYVLLPRLFPASFQMSPAFVQNRFNALVAQKFDVPFYALVGTARPRSCLATGGVGDGFTSQGSASASADVVEVDPTATHVGLPTNAQFTTYLLPRLAKPPAGAGAAMHAADADDAADDAADDDPSPVSSGEPAHVLLTGAVNVPANNSTTVNLPVNGGTGLAVDVIGPDLASALRNPSGATVDSIGTGGNLPARTHYVASPASGTWQLVLTNTTAAAIPISYAATLEGDPVTLAAVAGAPNGSNQVLLSATFTHNGTPVTGATVSAVMTNLAGTQTALTLLDDGASGDGAANDGVYGVLTSSLTTGNYTVTVTGTAASFSRRDFVEFAIPRPNAPPSMATVNLRLYRNVIAVINMAGRATDPNGDTVVVDSTSAPGHGAIVNNRSDVMYVPGTDFVGPDSFTMTIHDGLGGTTIVTVNILVVLFPPFQIAPKNLATGTLTPAYQFARISQTVQYSLAVYDLSTNALAFTRVIQQSTCTPDFCTATPTEPDATLKNNTPYGWYVAAYEPISGWSDWGNGTTFIPSVIPTTAPALVAPSGIVTGTTLNPTFQWNAVTGAVTYALAVFDMNTLALKYFTPVPASGNCTLTTCTVTPTGGSTTLTSGQPYGWFVAALSYAGAGPWSAGLAFIPFTTPAAPTLIAPTGTTSATPTYQWNAVADATQYFVAVLNGSGAQVFGQWVLASEVCLGQTCQYVQPTALAAGAYTWFVAAANPAGTSSFSTGLTISVGGAAPVIAPTFQP